MRCPNCGKTKFAVDKDTSEYYCTNCGYVMGSRLDFSGGRIRQGRKTTSYAQTGKGLGTSVPKNLSFYFKLRRWHATDVFSTKEERSFRRALHVLQIAWGRLHSAREVREASSLLYRHCIKLKLTNGRDAYTMAFAAISIALENFGMGRDIYKTAAEFEVKERLIRKYAKTIRKAIKRSRALGSA